MSLLIAAGKMLVKVAGPMVVEAGAKAVIDTVKDKVTTMVNGEEFIEQVMIEVRYTVPGTEERDSMVFTIDPNMDTKVVSKMIERWLQQEYDYATEYSYSWEAFEPTSLQASLNQQVRKD